MLRESESVVTRERYLRTFMTSAPTINNYDAHFVVLKNMLITPVASGVIRSGLPE
jgi:hypothetical protein